jgi:recombination protein RecT
MSNTEVTNRDNAAITQLRTDLHRMGDQFKFALPAHIPVERFVRVVMTAIQNNPKLMKCTRQSLFNACMKAAQDGLLPDGREGAIVPYGEDEDGKGKSDVAQWMPMIFGIRKKVRNSGALSDWNCQVVHEGDDFDYALGDNPYIHHKPSSRGGRTRPVTHAYSIAKFPDGTLSREVMNIDQIKDIQSKAKAKRGPWSDPIFYPEMCRKTVAKLHSKQLPMSTDLDTLMRRDDDLYNFAGASDRGNKAVARPSAMAAFDTFASEPPIEHDPPKQVEQQQPREVREPDQQPAQKEPEQTEPQKEPQKEPPAEPSTEALATAYERGKEAKTKGMARRAIPGEYRMPERTKEALAWARGWDGEAE